MNLSEVEKINKCTRMKIPETSANVGAYYGNEENGQWQPNGVIIDSGVGGGVVGSGDAGIHRPPVYPVHMPRAQVPAGYVMAGAFYPPAPFAVPAAPQDDFADYMWMEHEEEFDKQVMQQLEEEALMEQCIEAMLEDEQRERNSRPVANGHKQHATSSNGAPSLSLEETVSRSTLNPLAAEFVPTRVRTTPTEDEKPDPPEATQEQKEADPPAPESRLDSTEEVKTEDPVPPQKDPPEVSAADIQPITEKPLDKRPKDPKKDSRPKADPKKSQSLKPEVKAKAKPQTIKSETKVQPKKKEVKIVKSDARVEEKREVREEKREVREEKRDVKEEKLEEVVPCAVEEVKPQSPQIEDPSIPKPINYAAAARANKPKKPSSPPPAQPPAPPAQPPAKTKAPEKTKKPEKTVKPEKVNVQRKNSTK